jgi:hypothetical protein
VSEAVVDDIGEVAAEDAEGLGLGIPRLIRRSMSALAGGWRRSRVTAMRCSAVLSSRLPPRLSRNRCLLPVHTGMGAVPACMANAAEDRKRVMPAVSAMILAAVSPAQPGMFSSSGASCVISASMRRLSSLTR